MESGNLADAIGTARSKGCSFGLRHFLHYAEHLTRARKVELAFRAQLLKCGQDIVCPVDVRIHCAEAVGETLGDKALGREMVALVELVAADDLKNAGIAIQIGRMERDAIHNMTNSSEAAFRFFQRDSAHQAMNLIARVQQVLRQITSILSRNPSY